MRNLHCDEQVNRIIDAYGLYNPAYGGKEFESIPHAAVYVIDKGARFMGATRNGLSQASDE